MGEILVTSAKLRSTAQELQSLNEQFKSRVSDLENQESNLNSMWEGQANEAFHKAFMNDKTQMTNFYNLIIQYIQTLQNIAVEYDKAETINANTGNTRTY